MAHGGRALHSRANQNRTEVVDRVPERPRRVISAGSSSTLANHGRVLAGGDLQALWALPRSGDVRDFGLRRRQRRPRIAGLSRSRATISLLARRRTQPRVGRHLHCHARGYVTWRGQVDAWHALTAFSRGCCRCMRPRAPGSAGRWQVARQATKDCGTYEALATPVLWAGSRGLSTGELQRRLTGTWISGSALRAGGGDLWSAKSVV